MAAVRSLVPPTTVGVIVTVALLTGTSATNYLLNYGADVSGVLIGLGTQITPRLTSTRLPVLPDLLEFPVAEFNPITIY